MPRLLVLFGVILAMSSGQAHAQAQTLSDDQDFYWVESHLRFLADPERQWEIGDVASPEMDGLFEPTELGSGLPTTSSVYWVRLRIANEAGHRKQWLLSIRIETVDHLDVYTRRSGEESFNAVRTGMALPFSSREVPDRRFVFKLPDSPASTVYLRLESDGLIRFRAKVLSTEAYAQQRQRELFGLGLFYGIMLIAIASHLVVFLVVREVSYLGYVLFISVCLLVLAQYEGIAQQYLWPKSVAMPAGMLLLLLGASAPVFVIFAATFLQTKKRLPWGHRILLVLQGASAIWFISFPFVSLRVMGDFYRAIGFLSTLAVVGVGFAVWRRGYRPARYFFMAWVVFLLSFAVLVLIGSTSPGTTGHVAYIVLHLSIALTALVFSVALADQVKLQREQAGAEREKLIVELEASNSELERFSYSVSHDLKSPLITVRGFLGFLTQDIAAGNTERIVEDVSQIEEAVEKMQALLDDLLELSRVGRVINPPEDVPLEALVGDALKVVAGRISDLGTEIRVEPGMPSVHGDRIRLAEVLQNLIDNAVKYSGEQSEPRVEIGAETRDEEVHCYVRDNGRGIAPAYHDKVFDLFERLGAEEEGTGIGLALVKRIVEGHGGRVWIESVGTGHGSTFWVALPRSR